MVSVQVKVINKDEDLNKLRKSLSEFFNNLNKIFELYMQVSSVSTSKKPTLTCKSFLVKMNFNVLLSLCYTPVF